MHAFRCRFAATWEGNFPKNQRRAWAGLLPAIWDFPQTGKAQTMQKFHIIFGTACALSLASLSAQQQLAAAPEIPSPIEPPVTPAASAATPVPVAPIAPPTAAAPSAPEA